MKLLLADSSELFCTALKSQLDLSYEVQVCHDGVTAARLLFEDCPELLVLDMSLPEMDGFTILQTLRDTGRDIPVIVLTTRLTVFEYNWLQALCVKCILMKPCTICETLLRIHEVTRSCVGQQGSFVDDAAERMLLCLGLRMNLSGYQYVAMAVRLLFRNPEQTLTKEIYPSVARMCGATPQSVERAIRTVIRDAWSRRNESVWRLYFPSGRDGSIPCPQNGTFLARIAGCLIQLSKKSG